METDRETVARLWTEIQIDYIYSDTETQQDSEREREREREKERGKDADRQITTTEIDRYTESDIHKEGQKPWQMGQRQ